MMKTDIHIHSNFSFDAKPSIEEIAVYCAKSGYRTIGITDHVGRSTKGLKRRYKQIQELRKSYRSRMWILSGLEAKVTNLNGDIDIKKRFVKYTDFIVGSFHRLPCGDELYLSEREITKNKSKARDLWFISFMNLLKNPLVDVVGHPTYVLKKYGIELTKNMMEKIAVEAKRQNKILELSGRHNVPDAKFVQVLKRHGVKLLFGSDAHQLQDIKSYYVKRWEYKSNRLLVITKGGRKAGMGHVIRMLNLSRELMKKGFREVLFLMENYPEGIKAVKREGYQVKVIDKDRSLDEKIELTKTIAKQFDPDLVIVDLYMVNNRFLKGLKSWKWLLVAVSDLYRIDLDSDVVINGFLGFNNEIRKNKFGALCYLGPKYAIIGREYKSEAYDPNKTSILVTLGGEDRKALTLKAILAIDTLKQSRNTTVILGHAFAYKRDLLLLLRSLKEKPKVKGPVKSLKPYIKNASLVISAAGNTLYEIISVARPSLLLCQVEHQLHTAKIADSLGVAVNLGLGEKVSVKKLADEIKKLLLNKERRLKMVKMCRKICNGRPIHNVVNVLFKNMKFGV